ncbi:ribosome biogenesis GTPase Der [Candidatus Schneideria nysicola]|uniref:ribosome biogenesis GTPase Der n=1 Tax=Candidatus Schneideria nysicola TaxID=1081631 RepID=UPI001CAA6B09|nr:ribosome biogenesis GTPase Der [Candidatus Schneideria nysicola]UAJ65349.1 ribosome biogenesis GTPase Der [Candidatus Schneideria nysicola]
MKFIFSIALIGRHNVGKSTLFNRITSTNEALVTKSAGSTRDRKYGCTIINNYIVKIIDTASIELINAHQDKNSIESSIIKQSIIAINESDLIFFMVDTQTGIIAADLEIAHYLYTCNKNIMVIANKCDNYNTHGISEFFSLGMGEIYPISALQGLGLNNLLRKTVKNIIKKNLDNPPSLEERLEERVVEKIKSSSSNHSIRVAIVGRPNAGKSMLINRILGENRLIVYDFPGTTREKITIPIVRNNKHYTLIDTAGIRKKIKNKEEVETLSIIQTFKAIKVSHIVMIVIDATIGVTDEDLSLLKSIIERGHSILIIFNKWDLLSETRKKYIKNVSLIRLKFVSFARIHFISALYETKSGLDKMFQSINETFFYANKRISTALATRILLEAVKKHSPPILRRRRIKLKYAHIGGYNPLLFIIHGNQVRALSESYKRYLVNYFRNALKIIGSPIQIKLIESTNPYIS